MVYKTILVHCDAGRSTAGRLAVAVDLAERHQAHLVGLHARPPFQPPVFADGSYAIDLLVTEHDEAVTSSEAAASAAFARAVKGREITTEWHSVYGHADDLLTVHARYADLTIVGQNDPEGTRPPIPSDLPESVTLATGRGTLVVPYRGSAKVPGGNVLLCWNATRESARAASDSLPLLKAAGTVTVLLVEARPSPSGHGAMPGADVAPWLSRHGIKVDVQREAAADGDVGAVILTRALDLGADLIVMGLYGHTRVREWVLGGASRTVLAGMTVPVLMAH